LQLEVRDIAIGLVQDVQNSALEFTSECFHVQSMFVGSNITFFMFEACNNSGMCCELSDTYTSVHLCTPSGGTSVEISITPSAGVFVWYQHCR